MIDNSFNHQLTTSKLGKHSSSRKTRQVSKDVKRMSLEEAESFTSDQVTSAIKSFRSSRSYRPDSLSIFHLKNLGPLATEHLTARYNDRLKLCRLPSIWKTSLVIPIPKLGKVSSQGTSYRPIYLTAAFDTVSHDTLISKIAGSSLPPAITRWMSCYLRGDKLQLASEVLSRARESSAPASLKAQSCHLPCSTIT